MCWASRDAMFDANMFRDDIYVVFICFVGIGNVHRVFLANFICRTIITDIPENKTRVIVKDTLLVYTGFVGGAIAVCAGRYCGFLGFVLACEIGGHDLKDCGRFLDAILVLFSANLTTQSRLVIFTCIIAIFFHAILSLPAITE